MRSSWTDSDGLYVAMKSGKLTDHQTHGDLDAGDFVLDALGQRWAGELGNGDYLSEGYVSCWFFSPRHRRADPRIPSPPSPRASTVQL